MTVATCLFSYVTHLNTHIHPPTVLLTAVVPIFLYFTSFIVLMLESTLAFAGAGSALTAPEAARADPPKPRSQDV